ncbi:MAG: 3-methyl-2-oxobutanoate hydroxymethyltransferase [candidate division Zixibacteria bacterium]|nr:3-methyl-2-oxobutanoate hydroxymethyltransferase [candidate division Zixibacteria bacterium]
MPQEQIDKRKKIRIASILAKKERGEKISMLTAYDFYTAKLLDQAGVDMLLVGDSAAMVIHGHKNTLPITTETMLDHTSAVTRGCRYALVIADLPFMSYHISKEQAIATSGRFIKEALAEAVKLEGGQRMAETVRRIVQSGIPVMGHIGLTPQAVNQLGGYRVQGKSSREAIEILEDARALEEAGAYSIVLECVPAPLAALITERLTIPTIGIGAGVHCDGQVQVFHDLLGLFSDFVPKHARRYANIGDEIKAAVAEYAGDVQTQAFPTDKESFTMKQSVLEELAEQTAQQPA